MGWALRIAAGALLASALLAAAVLWGALRVVAPGPLGEPRTVVIPRGSSLETIATTLADAGIVESPWLFLFDVKLSGAGRDLKAGEYAFTPGISADGVVSMMRQGKTVVRRLTVPEGLTSAQIVALLEKEPALTGDVGERPKDGSLLPETYHFSFGDGRDGLLDRMRVAMEQTLADAWKRRDQDLPLRTPEEAVTLASIVEKETGVAAERARVAGVYVNRLRTGMRMQSDPTVIYALTQGSGELGRALTRNDLKTESPYNTYYAAGLPPGPIANPGKASILAALKPERHDYLYFVADGTGGHAFAKTLPDHNRNVARWRDVQRRQAENGESSSE
ncbi:MAG TPA: endolytic transglycosylase MltG [Azospirillum sp.]